jgi:hypothetical protein
MTLRSKGKKNETLELHTGSIQSHAEDTSANHTPSRKKSGSAPMKSILSVAASQVMSLMIGCKPKPNSSVRRRQRQTDFRSRERLNETS